MKIKDLETLKRFDAAQAIFAAKTLFAQRECLFYWPLFDPSSSGGADYYKTLDWEQAIEHYTYLRQLAFEWQTNQRFLELEARIEALEGVDNRLGDHR